MGIELLSGFTGAVACTSKPFIHPFLTRALQPLRDHGRFRFLNAFAAALVY